jgi:hypothetical protein
MAGDGRPDISVRHGFEGREKTPLPFEVGLVEEDGLFAFAPASVMSLTEGAGVSAASGDIRPLPILVELLAEDAFAFVSLPAQESYLSGGNLPHSWLSPADRTGHGLFSTAADYDASVADMPADPAPDLFPDLSPLLLTGHTALGQDPFSGQ